MSYVDGFVLCVPKDKIDAYIKMAEGAGKIWMEHGALSFHENVLEDSKAEFGVAFPKLAGAKENETVLFSYITFKSREHRDEVNKKVMADDRMNEMPKPEDMPFDCASMAYGGFKEIVSLSS